VCYAKAVSDVSARIAVTIVRVQIVTVIHRITGFLDFFHLPVFYKTENTTFRKLDLFPSAGEGGSTPNQLGPVGGANLNHSLRGPTE
jgi:hypothetical protein